MPLPYLAFYAIAAIIVVSALLVITRRSPIASALFLALSLLSVAGLYVMLHAEFLFAAQILVYTGGVMVLFLFVIMLVNIDDLALIRPAVKRWGIPATLIAVTFGMLAPLALRATGAGAGAGAAAGADSGLVSNTRAIAAVLFTDYLLPFEIVSVFLLVAMVGAIMLSRKEA